MWWVATIHDAALTNLEALVQYQVAAWNSATNGGNGVVRLAEYQADGASGRSSNTACTAAGRAR
jgi:hypothetical protein